MQGNTRQKEEPRNAVGEVAPPPYSQNAVKEVTDSLNAERPRNVRNALTLPKRKHSIRSCPLSQLKNEKEKFGLKKIFKIQFEVKLK